MEYSVLLVFVDLKQQAQFWEKVLNSLCSQADKTDNVISFVFYVYFCIFMMYIIEITQPLVRVRWVEPTLILIGWYGGRTFD